MIRKKGEREKERRKVNKKENRERQTDRDRQREGEREGGETDRQRDRYRQTEKERQRQTETEKEDGRRVNMFSNDVLSSAYTRNRLIKKPVTQIAQNSFFLISLSRSCRKQYNPIIVSLVSGSFKLK